MGNGSTAYAELGGGVDIWGPRPPRPRPAVAEPPPHVCHFTAVSGWCVCGRRDDGNLAEYSPAWHAARAGGAR